MYRRLLRRWRLIPLSMLALAVVATGGWFQATAPSQDQVPAPTIRVTTHLVVVDVVVTDKQGKPITGLHLEDFEVEENGKAQKVASLTTPEITPTGPELPPGVYSNRPQYRSSGAPITLILLDG